MTTYFQAKKRPRPSPIYTDRRSLNRARPPPIYLQREEDVTPGIYPKGRKPKRRSDTTPANPLASFIGGDAPKESQASSSTSSSSSSSSAVDRATPLRSINRASGTGGGALSRFQQERRVMSEDLAPRDNINHHSSSSSSSGHASIRNPLQNRLTSSQLRRKSDMGGTTSLAVRSRVASGEQQGRSSFDAGTRGDLGGGGGGGSSNTSGLGSLRLAKPLTQYQGGRNTTLNSRDLVSTGYAQLRNRTHVSNDEKVGAGANGLLGGSHGVGGGSATAAAAAAVKAKAGGGGGRSSLTGGGGGGGGAAAAAPSIFGGSGAGGASSQGCGGGGGAAGGSTVRLPTISPDKAARNSRVSSGSGAAAAAAAPAPVSQKKLLAKV